MYIYQVIATILTIVFWGLVFFLLSGGELFSIGGMVAFVFCALFASWFIFLIFRGSDDSNKVMFRLVLYVVLCILMYGMVYYLSQLPITD